MNKMIYNNEYINKKKIFYLYYYIYIYKIIKKIKILKKKLWKVHFKLLYLFY